VHYLHSKDFEGEEMGKFINKGKKLKIAIVLALVIGLMAGCSGNTQNEAPPADNGDSESSGGSYSDLMIMPSVELAPEEYAIGFRVGSDAVPEVNKIIKELNEDGTLAEIAAKYDLTYSMMTNEDMEASAVDMERTEEGDLAFIQEKGVLKIGMTLFAPMNYFNENGEFVGFDTEFAEAVCAKLGVTPEFIEINWDTKEIELAAQNIDCIWNGLTVTQARRENIEFTYSYVKNKQVVVIRKADEGKFTSIESLAAAKLSAEAGSAGEDAIMDDPILSAAPYTAMQKQTDTLLEVKAGTSDAAVLDYTAAKALVG